jgi:hypothetical protein
VKHGQRCRHFGRIAVACQILGRAINHWKPHGFREFLRVCFFSWGPVMMGRPPRVPVDLQAVTRDVKARVRRVVGDLEAIEQQQDPIFASPRDVFLELVLSIHELGAAAAKMRKAWWPPP